MLVVRWRVHALLTILRYHRWVWRRSCWNYTWGIWNTCQVSILRGVYHQWSSLCCQANSIRALISLLLLWVSVDQTLVTMRSSRTTWCWANAVWRMLSFSVLLLRIAENSLEEWSSVFLPLTICLLEANRSVWRVEALIASVRARATPSLVLWRLHFHTHLEGLFLLSWLFEEITTIYHLWIQI